MTESKNLSSVTTDKRVNLPSQCGDILPNLYAIKLLSKKPLTFTKEAIQLESHKV